MKPRTAVSGDLKVAQRLTVAKVGTADGVNGSGVEMAAIVSD
jgi:hypothetical protein